MSSTLKDKKTIITALILYLLSSAISYATFNFISDDPNIEVNPVALDTDSGSLLAIDSQMPRTEACPLNGALYTELERQSWEKRRPLAIMVENSVDARPHSGIIRADIVYEAVAEGGVTRFMPIFYCDAQSDDVLVAPVRSVRTYFLDWASEYGETPLFGHVGGANCSAEKLPNGSYGPCKTDARAQAIEQIEKYGWGFANDLNQFSIGAPTYVRRENRLFDLIGKDVATEHSVVASTEKLWSVGKKRGWTNLDPDGVDWTENFRPWKFKDGSSESQRGDVTTISHDFWEGFKQYDVRWEYDQATNSYLRFTGGEPHLDLETGKQISVNNVVVLLTEETGPVDDLKHMLYQTIGKGKALIFQDGKAIEGFWTKKDRKSRTIFTTKTGDEIEFVRGKIWISVVSEDTEVAY